MKKAVFILLFLCLSNGYASNAKSETENWCGTYFEEDGRGYIRLAREDLGIGSSECNLNSYQASIKTSGTADIALNFTKNRSTVSKWRKFNNHLIEVRGKFYNGTITSARFIRDMGI